jgi:hypothetical protein
MLWGENTFGKDFDTKDIFSTEINVDENTVRVFRPIRFTITHKEVQDEEPIYLKRKI